MPGSIELEGDQTTMPAENLLGLGDTGDLRGELVAETFAGISKCAALGVGEPDLAGQVCPQDSVATHRRLDSYFPTTDPISGISEGYSLMTEAMVVWAGRNQGNSTPDVKMSPER